VKGASETEVLRLRGEGAELVRDHVAGEAPLELRLGTRPLTVIMRTPATNDESDEELARGFLYTEGIIGSAAEIVSLTRPERLSGDEIGNVLSIELAPGAKPPVVERLFYSSSSCGVCGKASIAQLAVRAPKVTSTFTVGHAVLSALPERLRAAQRVFAETGGLHGAALFVADGRVVAVREDVGRHNAVDKLVGWALAEGRLPLADCLLLVSGRVGFEIVQKAIAAGLPLVAAVGAPSSLAVDLAEQFGLTLVGFLRADSLNVYSRNDRVT
jgi:FdhD protein